MFKKIKEDAVGGSLSYLITWVLCLLSQHSEGQDIKCCESKTWRLTWGTKPDFVFELKKKKCSEPSILENVARKSIKELNVVYAEVS